MQKQSPFAWIDALAARLQGPLPGLAAQLEAFPGASQRPGMEHLDPVTFRPAAVLFLLYPHRGRWYFPLEKRPEELPAHRGQIGLPGGAMEPGDRSPEETALREAAEEVGLDPSAPIPIGRLSPVWIPVSRFRVTPVVAWMRRRPSFLPNPQEVVRLLEVPVEALLDAGRFRVERWILQGRPQQVGCFYFDGERVWGATAMILCEFRALLRQLLDDPRQARLLPFAHAQEIFIISSRRREETDEGHRTPATGPGDAPQL